MSVLHLRYRFFRGRFSGDSSLDRAKREVSNPHREYFTPKKNQRNRNKEIMVAFKTEQRAKGSRNDFFTFSAYHIPFHNNFQGFRLLSFSMRRALPRFAQWESRFHSAQSNLESKIKSQQA
jgi:hypothetical protein